MADISAVPDFRMVLRVSADCFIPEGHRAAAYISKKFKERLSPTGTTWRHVDQDIKTFYYEKFLKCYTWEEGHEEEFKATWNIYCAKLYKDLLYKWRRRGTRPTEVPIAIWEAWTVVWTAERWQSNSVIARGNHKTEVAGPSTGSTKHTVGSRSIVEHAVKLAAQLDRSPTCWEVFNKTHKKKDDTFVDQRSLRINEAMTSAVAQTTQPDAEGEESQTLSTDAINDIYYDVVGGRKKSSLYSLGSQAKVVYDRMRGPSGTRGRPSSSSSSEVATLRQENQELRTRLSTLEQSMAARDEAQAARDAAQAARDTRHEELYRHMLAVQAQFSQTQQPQPDPHRLESQETQDPDDTDDE